jgi:hypothetical protein
VRTLVCLAILISAAGSAPAEVGIPSAGLRDALAARSMLGAETRARLVRIDNSGRRRGDRYPKIVYALVFELSGILWFYTDTDGTQSLSLTLGTTERDMAEPGPLFRAIDPGFTAWSWVSDPAGPPVPAPGRPPNACFEASLGALYRRASAGGEARAPRLLSYYVDTPGGRLGHTVLLYETRAGLEAIDAEDSEHPVELPAYLRGDPRAVAAYLRGGPVAAARTLPILGTGRLLPAGRWAALPSHPAPAG